MDTGGLVDFEEIRRLDMEQLWARVCSRGLCLNEAGCDMETIRAPGVPVPACETMYNLLSSIATTARIPLTSSTTTDKGGGAIKSAAMLSGILRRVGARAPAATPAAGAASGSTRDPVFVDTSAEFKTRVDRIERQAKASAKVMKDQGKRIRTIREKIKMRRATLKVLLGRRINETRSLGGGDPVGMTVDQFVVFAEQINDALADIESRERDMDGVTTGLDTGATGLGEIQTVTREMTAAGPPVVPMAAPAGGGADGGAFTLNSGGQATDAGTATGIPALFRVNEAIMVALTSTEADIKTGIVFNIVQRDPRGRSKAAAATLATMPFGKLLAFPGVRAAVVQFCRHSIAESVRDASGQATFAVQHRADASGLTKVLRATDLAKAIINEVL